MRFNTVRTAKPGLKVVRLKDDRGLYLEISPAGGKWWRLRYWIDSKENRLSLGTYPEISLKEARERRDDDLPGSFRTSCNLRKCLPPKKGEP
jgi:hypothetical protein